MDIKGKCNIFIENFRRLKASEAFYKLFLSWLLVSVFYIAVNKPKFTDTEFFKDINLAVFIAAAAIVWIVLCQIKSKRFITSLMLISALVYAVLAAVGFSDFGFSIGLCAAVGIVIVFSDTDEIKLPMHRSIPWILMGVLTALITAFVGLICCLYYKNHWTPNYDFGLFAQMYENMRTTGLPLITCERDKLLSHFAVHFSPVFYLILPVYMLLPSPVTLLAASAFIVASGAVPMMFICKNHKLSDKACCAFAVIYALYPCLSGGCFYYLHENNFLAPMLLWFIYFSEKSKLVPQIVFMLLTLSIKEDAAIYLIVTALYFMLSQKKIKRNLFFILFPLAYFIGVTILLKNMGNGVMTYRYDNFIYDQSGSLITAIAAVIKNPVYVISQSITEQKLIFILKMMLPLAFLPVLTKKASRYILFVPFLLVNLMTTYKYQYDIFYHYCFGSGVMLLYLAAVNYADLKKPKLLLFGMFSSVIVFTCLFNPRNKYISTYEQSAVQRETIDRALAMVPRDESVSASTFLIANLYDCSEIYELETTKNQTKYYVIDMRYTTPEVNINEYLNDDYETVFYEKDVVAVFMRK